MLPYHSSTVITPLSDRKLTMVGIVLIHLHTRENVVDALLREALTPVLDVSARGIDKSPINP